MINKINKLANTLRLFDYDVWVENNKELIIDDNFENGTYLLQVDGDTVYLHPVNGNTPDWIMKDIFTIVNSII